MGRGEKKKGHGRGGRDGSAGQGRGGPRRVKAQDSDLSLWSMVRLFLVVPSSPYLLTQKVISMSFWPLARILVCLGLPILPRGYSRCGVNLQLSREAEIGLGPRSPDSGCQREHSLSWRREGKNHDKVPPWRIRTSTLQRP